VGQFLDEDAIRVVLASRNIQVDHQSDGSRAGQEASPRSIHGARVTLQRQYRTADLAPRRSVLTVRQAGGTRFGHYALVADKIGGVSHVWTLTGQQCSSERR